MRAFRNSAGAGSRAWHRAPATSDAGQKLASRISTSLTTLQYTFDTLRGGAASTDVTIASAGTGAIKRRIYTTNGNGVYTQGLTDTQKGTALQNNSGGPVNFRPAIWPPRATVDPPGSGGSHPAGLLDNSLGIGRAPVPPPTGGSAPAALTLAQLQSLFGACTAAATGGTLPPDCSSTTLTTPSGYTAALEIRLQLAEKETRPIILAYTAGAALVTS